MSRGIQSVLVGGQGQKTNAYSHGEQLRGKMLDTQPHTSKLCQRNRWAKKVNGYLKSRTRYMFLIYKYIYIYICLRAQPTQQKGRKVPKVTASRETNDLFSSNIYFQPCSTSTQAMSAKLGPLPGPQGTSAKGGYRRELHHRPLG